MGTQSGNDSYIVAFEIQIKLLSVLSSVLKTISACSHIPPSTLLQFTWNTNNCLWPILHCFYRAAEPMQDNIKLLLQKCPGCSSQQLHFAGSCTLLNFSFNGKTNFSAMKVQLSASPAAVSGRLLKYLWLSGGFFTSFFAGDHLGWSKLLL